MGYPRGVQLRHLAPIALVAGCVLAGCASGPGYKLPPEGGQPDYQLGASYPPPAGVDIVARDRTADAPDGTYGICYLNGFQTQPGEAWDQELLMRDEAGEPLIDPNWPDETLLDTSTSRNREAIAERMRPWIEECATKGFDAVEFDNLDSHLRSGGALTFDDNFALARTLVAIAHDAGLAAGQKNSSEHSRQLKDEAGFDFAVTEECGVFDECDAYRDVYGPHVIGIEYTDTDLDFAAACADGILPASVVLRDRDLVGPDDPAYRFEVCR